MLHEVTVLNPVLSRSTQKKKCVHACMHGVGNVERGQEKALYPLELKSNRQLSCLIVGARAHSDN